MAWRSVRPTWFLTQPQMTYPVIELEVHDQAILLVRDNVDVRDRLPRSGHDLGVHGQVPKGRKLG